MEFVLKLNLHRRHLTSSQRAALSGDVVKELELEAKERKRLLSGTRSNPGTIEQVPQMFAEPALRDDPEPYHPPRNATNGAHTSAKSTTHTAQTKPVKKDKSEGEAREKAAQLLGTNHDYISKIKKLETLECRRPHSRKPPRLEAALGVGDAV